MPAPPRGRDEQPERAAELLNAFLDGEATIAEEQEARSLIGSSPDLQGELCFLQSFRASVGRIDAAQPPPELRERIRLATTARPGLLPALRRLAERTPGLRLGAAAALAAACCALIALIAHQPTRQASPVQLAVKPRSVSPVTSRRYPRRQPAGAAEQRVAIARKSPELALIPAPIVRVRRASNRAAVRVARRIASMSPIPVLHRRSQRRSSDQAGAPRVAWAASPAPDQSLPIAPNVPMMDTRNEHSGDAAAPSSTEGPPRAQVLTGAPPAATPEVVQTKGPDGATRYVVHVAHLSQPAPAAPHFLNVADIQRQQAMRNGGFNRLTLESIRNREATISLIGSRF